MKKATTCIFCHLASLRWHLIKSETHIKSYNTIKYWRDPDGKIGQNMSEVTRHGAHRVQACCPYLKGQPHGDGLTSDLLSRSAQRGDNALGKHPFFHRAITGLWNVRCTQKPPNIQASMTQMTQGSQGSVDWQEVEVFQGLAQHSTRWRWNSSATLTILLEEVQKHATHTLPLAPSRRPSMFASMVNTQPQAIRQLISIDINWCSFPSGFTCSQSAASVCDPMSAVPLAVAPEGAT